MEACVYEDSPLANYLEGEGEGQEDWAPQGFDWTSAGSEDHETNNFAPQGLPKFHERLRNKIPEPLRLKHSRNRESLAKIQDACTAVISARIGKGDNERFLEQFGYIIVASQLLNEQTGAPSYTSISGLLSDKSQNENNLPVSTTIFDLRGAIFTALASFSVVWLLHWARSIHRAGWDVKKSCAFVFLLVAVAFAFHSFAKRQWLKYLRRQAVDIASVFVGNAQTLDSAASASVVLIQEVELVSRGYRVSTPMPPVTRLEEQTQSRRCLKLRRILFQCLVEMLDRYLVVKQKLRALVDNDSLEKYCDIYDVSREEMLNVDPAFVKQHGEDETSLRSLRTLFARLYNLRKMTLCCLLALPADGEASDLTRWGAAVEEMQQLATMSADRIRRITDILNEQDREMIVSSPRAKATPERDRHRAQLRRINSLSQGIRGLHAKMHIIREESDTCLDTAEEQEEANLSSTLITQYESIGADLRGLLQEWEAGRSAIIANTERPERLSTSRPPSTLITPSSPTFSLDGITAVDTSPSTIPQVLNIDDLNHLNPDNNAGIDEIFEAVALPRSRKRNSMTREERIARVKEDRAKQAAARDKTDANTHMLRELETVIKLRPRGKSGGPDTL